MKTSLIGCTFRTVDRKAHPIRCNFPLNHFFFKINICFMYILLFANTNFSNKSDFPHHERNKNKILGAKQGRN